MFKINSFVIDRKIDSVKLKQYMEKTEFNHSLLLYKDFILPTKSIFAS